jgi:hypothetical protein
MAAGFPAAGILTVSWGAVVTSLAYERATPPLPSQTSAISLDAF